MQLIKELLSITESGPDPDHALVATNDTKSLSDAEADIVMGGIAGYLMDVIPEILFEVTALTDSDVYSNEGDQYKAFFDWENEENHKKYGKGSVIFACGIQGKRIVDVKLKNLNGNLGVKIDQSIFESKSAKLSALEIEELAEKSYSNVDDWETAAHKLGLKTHGWGYGSRDAYNSDDEKSGTWRSTHDSDNGQRPEGWFYAAKIKKPSRVKEDVKEAHLSNLNVKVEVKGKVYDAIYINDWTTTDLRTAAEECNVSLKGPLGSAKQSIMKTQRHYVIRNFTDSDGRQHKRYFATPAFVKSYKIKEI